MNLIFHSRLPNIQSSVTVQGASSRESCPLLPALACCMMHDTTHGGQRKTRGRQPITWQAVSLSQAHHAHVRAYQKPAGFDHRWSTPKIFYMRYSPLYNMFYYDRCYDDMSGCFFKVLFSWRSIGCSGPKKQLIEKVWFLYSLEEARKVSIALCSS